MFRHALQKWPAESSLRSSVVYRRHFLDLYSGLNVVCGVMFCVLMFQDVWYVCLEIGYYLFVRACFFLESDGQKSDPLICRRLGRTVCPNPLGVEPQALETHGGGKSQ